MTESNKKKVILIASAVCFVIAFLSNMSDAVRLSSGLGGLFLLYVSSGLT